MKTLFSNPKQEKGQGLVEYAIILALVAVVVIAVMGAMGTKVVAAYGNVMIGMSNSCEEAHDTQIDIIMQFWASDTDQFIEVLDATNDAVWNVCTGL